jgi:hypothetical protein
MVAFFTNDFSHITLALGLHRCTLPDGLSIMQLA